MAIVIAPALSMDASGNVGSINYTKWRGRNVARTTYTYTDPNTTAQQSARAKLTYLADYWGSTLTAAQRQTWAERAAEVKLPDRLGRLYNPTPFNLFISWNLQLAQIADLPYNSAPLGREKTAIEELELAATAFPGEVKTRLVKAAGIDVDCRAVMYKLAGPFDSPARRPILPEYVVEGYEKPPTTHFIYGLLAKYYWVKAYGVFQSGRRTVAFEGQVLPL